MKTTETLDLLLNKLPPTARTSHRCPVITNNLLSVIKLCNAGCSVLFLKHGVTVEFNGEIVLRGWRDQRNNLWRVPITSEGEGQSIIPPTPPADYNPSQGIIMQSLINSIYECANKKKESYSTTIRFLLSKQAQNASCREAGLLPRVPRPDPQSNQQSPRN